MFCWLLVASALSAAPGCTKDTDCKGERICEAGKCVNPPARDVAPPEAADAGVALSEPPLPPPPPPPPTGPNPADYPKVTRLNGVTCVETLGGDGQVQKDCRAEGAAYTGAPRDEQESPPVGTTERRRGETEEERSNLVGDFAAMGTLGLAVAGPGVGIGPGFGLHASLGGRLSESAALGGMLNGQFLFGGGTVIAVTLAPALRLGDVGHATLALGPALIVAMVGGLGTGTALAGSFIIHGGIPLAGGFGVHPHFGVTFWSGGAIFTFSFGFGGSLF
ncbi:MAG: hypothetical protein AB1938_21410 [Myxococcota bacterium]